jgi:hypothetical protein
MDAAFIFFFLSGCSASRLGTRLARSALFGEDADSLA